METACGEVMRIKPSATNRPEQEPGDSRAGSSGSLRQPLKAMASAAAEWAKGPVPRLIAAASGLAVLAQPVLNYSALLGMQAGRRGLVPGDPPTVMMGARMTGLGMGGVPVGAELSTYGGWGALGSCSTDGRVLAQRSAFAERMETTFARFKPEIRTNQSLMTNLRRLVLDPAHSAPLHVILSDPAWKVASGALQVRALSDFVKRADWRPGSNSASTSMIGGMMWMGQTEWPSRAEIQKHLESEPVWGRFVAKSAAGMELSSLGEEEKAQRLWVLYQAVTMTPAWPLWSLDRQVEVLATRSSMDSPGSTSFWTSTDVARHLTSSPGYRNLPQAQQTELRRLLTTFSPVDSFQKFLLKTLVVEDRFLDASPNVQQQVFEDWLAMSRSSTLRSSVFVERIRASPGFALLWKTDKAVWGKIRDALDNPTFQKHFGSWPNDFAWSLEPAKAQESRILSTWEQFKASSLTRPVPSADVLYAQLQRDGVLKGLDGAAAGLLQARLSSEDCRFALSHLLEMWNWELAHPEARRKATLLATGLEGLETVVRPQTEELDNIVRESSRALSTEEQDILRRRLRTQDEVGDTLRQAIADKWNEPQSVLRRNPQDRAQILLDLLNWSDAHRDGHGVLKRTPTRPGVFGGTNEHAPFIVRAAPPISSPQQALLQAEELPGFGQLSHADQQALRAVLSGRHNQWSYLARETWSGEHPAIQAMLQPSQQKEALQSFLNDSFQNYLSAGLVEEAGRRPIGSYNLTEMTAGYRDFGFFRERRDAAVWKLEFEGQTITIVRPKAKDVDFLPKGFALPTIEEVAQGLAMLHPAARLATTTIVLEPKPLEQTSAAYLGDGIMAYFPTNTTHIEKKQGDKSLAVDRFTSTQNHEIGHAMWVLVGNPRAYQEAVRKDGSISVSGYEDTNLEEGHADMVRTYLSTLGTPAHREYRLMYPHRFAEIDREWRAMLIRWLNHAQWTPNLENA
jgi:hypothetical protein